MPRPPRGQAAAQNVSARDVANTNSTLNTLFGARRPAWLSGSGPAVSQQRPKPSQQSTQVRPFQSNTNVPSNDIRSHDAQHSSAANSPSSMFPSPAATNNLSPIAPLGGGSPAFLNAQPANSPAPGRDAPLHPNLSAGDAGNTSAHEHLYHDGGPLLRVHTTLRPLNLSSLPNDGSSAGPSQSIPAQSGVPDASLGNSTETAVARSSLSRASSKRPASESSDVEPPYKRLHIGQMPAENAPALLMEDLAKALAAQIATWGGFGAMSNTTERQRYNFLSQACAHKDAWYIVLHCVLSQWSLNSKPTYHSLRVMGYDREIPAMDASLHKLSELLRPSQHLNIRHLQWFARYPSHSLPHLRLALTANVFDQCMSFLVRFGTEWPKLVAEVSQRDYPLLVHELLRMQCSSSTLQDALLAYLAGVLDVSLAINELLSESAQDRAYETMAAVNNYPHESRLLKRQQRALRYQALIRQHREQHEASRVRGLGSASTANHAPRQSSAACETTWSTGRDSPSSQHPHLSTASQQEHNPLSQAGCPPASAAHQQYQQPWLYAAHQHQQPWLLASQQHQRAQNQQSWLTTTASSQDLPRPNPRQVPQHTAAQQQQQQPERSMQFQGQGHHPPPTWSATATSAPPSEHPAYVALSQHSSPGGRSPGLPQLAFHSPLASQYAGSTHAGPGQPMARAAQIQSIRSGSVQHTQASNRAQQNGTPSHRANGSLNVRHDRNTSQSSHARPIPNPQQRIRVIPPQDYPHDAWGWASLDAGLHLVRQRSPIREPEVPTRNRFYQFVAGYAALKPLMPKKGLEIIHFSCLDRTFVDLVTKRTRNGLDRCQYREGSVRFRFRICKYEDGIADFENSAAAVAPTFWPENIYISLNNQNLQPRRKQHFRHDLPVEITDVIKAGDNTIVVSLPEPPGPQHVRQKFLLMIEVVKISSDDAIKRMIESSTPFTEAETRKELQRRLARSEDDDIVVEDNHLAVSLADPFSSTMFTTPVRSIHCKHIECFDLDNWLASRQAKPSKRRGEPCRVDEWKCPICGGDARPHKLRIDDFFVAVRDKLLADGAGRTRLIRVDAEGLWTAVDEQEDSEDEEEDLLPPPAAATGAEQQASRLPSRPAPVVVLDDE